KLVQVAQNLVVAKFDLMKFTPAKHILDAALASGHLRAGGRVIESSSGTFALALSILCSLYDLRLTLVTGPTSQIVRWRLENMGAVLHTVHASKNCEGGIQQARLEMLAELRSS
ncbi:pyridoxal-5'-phosphate-dependent protein subunit beta, partial [Mesorhizobium sp. M1C.F.Ca.ET.176.01.1.1]